MKCVKEYKCSLCLQIKPLEKLIFTNKGCVCIECSEKEKKKPEQENIIVLC